MNFAELPWLTVMASAHWTQQYRPDDFRPLACRRNSNAAMIIVAMKKEK
jgi:hypothetical protein